VLTVTGGVDVLGALETLAFALEGNNLAGARATLDTLSAGVDQVSQAHAQVGYRLRALDEADGYRKQFELGLSALVQRSLEGDPTLAVSEMMQAKVALEAAQAVAVTVNRLVQGGGQ
jgi:flagellin-like hook-associated protein FlgL